MIETLPQLLALQAYDHRIQQATHTLDTLQQSLTAVKEEEQTKVQEVQAWRDKISESEKASSRLILQIEQIKNQLRGKRGVLHHRRAGQQEETVQREIALLEASKADFEGELRTVTAQIARDGEALHQAEEIAAAHHARVLGLTSAVSSESAVVEEELHAAQDRRTALATEINAFLLQEYERIFARRGGMAVVALANETCQGCHMHLPPQMCLELQRRPKLTFCPHCHRILFTPGAEGRPLATPQPAADNSNKSRTRPSPRPIRSKARTAEEPREGAAFPPPSPAPA